MKIITWNVNRFDGVWDWYSKQKDRPDNIRKEIAKKIIEKLNVLLTTSEDIAILQEVPYCAGEWKSKWKEMFAEFKIMFWFDCERYRKDFNYGSKNITMAVTKSDSNWDISAFDKRKVRFDESRSENGGYWDYANRYIELVNKDKAMSILGFHLSQGEDGKKQWDKIHESADNAEFTFIVGDFNINDLKNSSNTELKVLEKEYKRTINNDIITQNQALSSIDNIFVKSDICINPKVLVLDYCFVTKLDGEKDQNIRYSDHNACICELVMET